MNNCIIWIKNCKGKWICDYFTSSYILRSGASKMYLQYLRFKFPLYKKPHYIINGVVFWLINNLFLQHMSHVLIPNSLHPCTHPHQYFSRSQKYYLIICQNPSPITRSWVLRGVSGCEWVSITCVCVKSVHGADGNFVQYMKS